MSQVGNLIGLAGGAPQTATAATQGVAAKATSAAETLGLKLGDIVEAGLVEDLGKGEGIVDIGGRLLRANCPEGMAAGVRVTLRVVSTGPPMVLKVPSPGEEGLTTLLSPPATSLTQTVRALLAAADSPEGGELRKLLEGFELLRLPTAPTELAPSLARLLQKSGLFHEALLARGEDPGDLKSLALRLLDRAVDPSLTKLSEALLGHIEAHQARSTLEGAVVIPFVLPWGGDAIHGEWVVDERFGRGPSGEVLSGALHVRLEMPQLGPVEVSFRWGPAGNAVRLRLNPTGLDAVTTQLPDLARALSEDAGIRLLDLRAEPLSPATATAGRGLLEVLA